MARSHPYGLSKSRITAFEQCPLKLWLSIRRPELAIADDGAEIRFATGHEVGEIACQLHPDGIMIEADPDLAQALRYTRERIEQGGSEPLFEATFEHDGVLVRVDVLIRDPAGVCLFEVKSSSGVKDYHLGDLATQVWVVRQAGLTIRAAGIRHINSAFRLRQEGDYAGLFTDVELLDTLEGRVSERPSIVAAARAILAGEEPVVATGEHCSRPFACEFWTYCTRHDPPAPDWPVALLPRTGKSVAAQWASRGVLDLREVPEGELTSPQHERIRQATLTGEVFHDLQGAIRDTAPWAWPRAFLDFETIAPAVPRWVGTGPYQQIPFQFSCHIEQETGELAHTGYLSLDGSDPRRGCAEALVKALGGERCGSVIAYNAAFERRCVLDLAEAFADLAADLRVLAAKIVDLLPVTRSHYYHRNQRGSWSIKAVLPTVAPELAYDDLAVKDGDAAQLAWFEASNPYTDELRREALRSGLEAYCRRDTDAMVVLLKRLTGEMTV
jgi:hypothetical protein